GRQQPRLGGERAIDARTREVGVCQQHQNVCHGPIVAGFGNIGFPSSWNDTPESTRMSVIVVANPKGGVGKSTLATQISGFLASQGKRVTLGDLDRQQSSRQWLDIRPPHLPRIEPWELSREAVAP